MVQFDEIVRGGKDAGICVLSFPNPVLPRLRQTFVGGTL